MTQRIFYKCDAPGCDREVDEEGDLRILERTAFGRGAVNVERRHACSAVCEGSLLRSIAFDILRGSPESKTLRELFARENLSERWVTDHGETILPPQMRGDLDVDKGGVVWFSKVAGRWSAYKDGETVCEPPVHAEACGTEYRGCTPECPKDGAEQEAERASEEGWYSIDNNFTGAPFYTKYFKSKLDAHLMFGEVGVRGPYATSDGAFERADKIDHPTADSSQQGWYVLPDKRGFDGAGWFEVREAAEQGLERGVLGPFPTMHEARRARERAYPVLAPGALSDLLRLAGRHVATAVVKTWSVADQCEAEAWAAFTLSDPQLGVRRAPPEPAHVREGAVIKLRTGSMYGKTGESAPSVPVWRSPIDARSRFPVEYFSQKGIEDLRSKAMHFCPNLQCAGFQKIGPGGCEKCGAGLVTSVVRVSDSVPDQNSAPEPSQIPTTAEPFAPQSCAGSAEACPAAPQKATTTPSVVRVSWKTEDGTYSCDVDVAEGGTFYMAGKMITVDPLPVRPAAEFYQIAPTDPDRETTPTSERPPPNAVERTAGIRYSETTPEERAAVGRVKSAYYDLSSREKEGSHTDVITDLTVAIVAEMRRAAREGAEKIGDVLDQAGVPRTQNLSDQTRSLVQQRDEVRRSIQSVERALDDAGSPADPNLFERVQWLTRRAAHADRVHGLLDDAGFAPDASLPGRVLDALAELLDGAGVAGQRPLKVRVADLRDQATTRQRAAEQQSGYVARVWELHREVKAEREKDAQVGRLQDELRRQRDDLLAELNAARDDRSRLSEQIDCLVEERNRLAKVVRVFELSDSVPVVLHCPSCGTQHVDAPDPPHRSHLCASCGCVWRAADVPTRGVAAPSTRGEQDTWPDPRGDGPGWYAAPGEIGWFVNRGRARAVLQSAPFGPLQDGNAARAEAGESAASLRLSSEDEHVIRDWLSCTLCYEVTVKQVVEWTAETRVNAATWAAYRTEADRIGGVKLVYDRAPKPPAPPEVERAHGESIGARPC